MHKPPPDGNKGDNTVAKVAQFILLTLVIGWSAAQTVHAQTGGAGSGALFGPGDLGLDDLGPGDPGTGELGTGIDGGSGLLGTPDADHFRASFV